MLTGIDTTKFRPIELLIESAPDSVLTPTQSTMFVFLHHDLLVRFSIDGITTAGYG